MWLPLLLLLPPALCGGLPAAPIVHEGDPYKDHESPDMCLQPSNSSVGAVILMNKCTGAVEQNWVVSSQGLVWAGLEGFKPQMCIDAGTNPTNGTHLTLQPCSPGVSQSFFPNSTHYVLLPTPPCDGGAFGPPPPLGYSCGSDASQPKPTTTTPTTLAPDVQSYISNLAADKAWADDEPSQTVTPVAIPPRPTSIPSFALCLDLTNGTCTPGMPAQVWQCNEGCNQDWRQVDAAVVMATTAKLVPTAGARGVRRVMAWED